ncbi:CBS domain-containing protein [Actinacidiphila alni]|uniref:CBS domain-containing protein n=1 Tax=Actinacidiphila alni TaxID=380248 RepID=A0A1I2JTM4_9ACTN|nr:CBS domain-containing protein [Actinacidiphila alni]SFF58155.1 CBS domain-containing protein [Actinacidiphila alni]
MTLLVKDVMAAGPAAVRPDASLAEVARLMREQRTDDVLVAHGDALLGVVSARDIGVPEGVDPQGVSVDSVCGADPVTVRADDPAGEAYRLMREHDVRRLPVVDDGKPVGIVGLGDLTGGGDDGRAAGESEGDTPEV